MNEDVVELDTAGLLMNIVFCYDAKVREALLSLMYQIYCFFCFYDHEEVNMGILKLCSFNMVQSSTFKILLFFIGCTQ